LPVGHGDRRDRTPFPFAAISLQECPTGGPPPPPPPPKNKSKKKKASCPPPPPSRPYEMASSMGLVYVGKFKIMTPPLPPSLRKTETTRGTIYSSWLLSFPSLIPLL
ncbi:unnamed protein product, partial [Ixodes persulcatus]